MSVQLTKNSGPNFAQRVVSESKSLKDQVKYVNHGCKMITLASTMVNTVSVVSGPLAKAAVYTSGFSTVAGLFKTVGHAKDFVCPDEKGTYNWQFWKPGSKWSVEETASNVLLTGADLIDPILFAAKIGLIVLGAATTPLIIAKNTMLVFASVFGGVDNSRKLYQNDKACAEGEELVAKRMHKWKDRTTKIKEFRAAGVTPGHVELAEKEQAVKDLFKDKIAMIQDFYKLPPTEMDEKKKHKVEKWTLLLTGKADLPADLDNLKADDKALNRIKKFSEKRIEQLTDYSKAIKGNHYIKRTTNALGLTNNICQLLLGIIGLIGVVLALSGIGVVAAAPAFIIACAAGWFVSQVLGLTKDLYSEYNKPLKLINMKDLTPLKAIVAQAA